MVLTTLWIYQPPKGGILSSMCQFVIPRERPWTLWGKGLSISPTLGAYASPTCFSTSGTHQKQDGRVQVGPLIDLEKRALPPSPLPSSFPCPVLLRVVLHINFTLVRSIGVGVGGRLCQGLFN